MALFASLQRISEEIQTPPVFEPRPVTISTQDPDMQPLYHNQLKNICVSGPWVMSDKDFLEVLANYAPSLVSLQVDRFKHGIENRWLRILPSGDPRC